LHEIALLRLTAQRIAGGDGLCKTLEPAGLKVFRHGYLITEGILDPLFNWIPVDNWGGRRRLPR
jgi:hypothetical protein